MEYKDLQAYKESLELQLEYQSQLAVKRKQFEEDNSELFDKLVAEQNNSLLLKEILTSQGLIDYSETLVKQLMGGLGIRVSSQLSYDELKAFDWALDHKLCLQLDSRAFEKIAKEESSKIDFVTVSEKIIVTFPKEIQL